MKPIYIVWWTCGYMVGEDAETSVRAFASETDALIFVGTIKNSVNGYSIVKEYLTPAREI